MEKTKKIQIDNTFVVQHRALEKSIIHKVKIISTLFANRKMQCFAKLFQFE